MKPRHIPPTRAMLTRFRDYHFCHPSWGTLHVVLDDLNLDDAAVDFCARYAREEGDIEGYQLACALRDMSPSQRRKLARGGYRCS